MPRCFIFAAGDFYGLRARPEPGDLVIAADAWPLACRLAGIVPSLLLGDLDSLTDPAGDGIPFPYVLVTKGGGTLEAGTTFRVAFVMNGYTEEAARTYGIQEEPGSVREFLRTWLTEQRTVSPGGNPWE